MLSKFKDVLKRYSIFMILYIFTYVSVIEITNFFWLYIVLGILIGISFLSYLIFKYDKNEPLSDYSYDAMVVFILLLLFTLCIKTAVAEYQLIFMLSFAGISLLFIILAFSLKKISEHALIILVTISLSLLTLALFQLVEIATGTRGSLFLYITITLLTAIPMSLFFSTNLFHKHYDKHYKICPILNRDLNSKLAIQSQKED